MIGILSDAHGHLAAFEKGWDLLERRGARRFIFLGDAVGYIPGSGVVEALARRSGIVTCIRGNHEDMLLSGRPNERDRIYRHSQTLATMNADMRDFIGNWNRSLQIRAQGSTILLVHGSPDDTQNGYIYPDSDLDRFDGEFDYLFCGHTHRPFERTANGRTFVNVGSCGLPRDDGRFGSAALFDPVTGAATILRYDIQAETDAMLSAQSDLDASVIDLFARRADQIVGEF